MRHIAKSAFGACVIASLAMACAGMASADTKSYDVTGFDQLDISAGVEVKFQIGPNWSVEATTNEAQDTVKVRAKGNRLYLSRKNSLRWSDRGNVRFNVTAPSLNEIEASSGSTLLAEGIATGQLELKASSGATISVYGTCSDLDINANSGGTINAKEMKCDTVAAKASSGGSLSSYAKESASSKTSTGGSVVIYGNPSVQRASDSITGGSTRFKSG